MAPRKPRCNEMMGFKELTKAPSAIAAGYLHEIASSFMEWYLFLYHRQVIVIVIKKITENICISFKSRVKDSNTTVFGKKDSNNIHKTQVPFTPPMSKTPAGACDGQVRVS